MRFAWIDERPFTYLAQGRLEGCDVALARAAARRSTIDLTFVRTTFDDLLPGLVDGRWDITTGMFITAARQRSASFTRPIWALADGLLLPATRAAGIAGYQDFAATGGNLAVLRDQVQSEHAVAWGLGRDRLVVFDEYAQAREAVLDGRVAGYASVGLAHEQALQSSPTAELVSVRVPSTEVPPAPGGFACARQEVRDLLDAALTEILGTAPPGEPSANPADWPR